MRHAERLRGPCLADETGKQQHGENIGQRLDELNRNDADHRVGTRDDDNQAKFAIVWLKRYVDNDTRYDQFRCPGPGPDPAIEEYRDTCPA